MNIWQVYSIDERLRKLSDELKTKVSAEAEARNKDVDGLKRELSRIPRGGGGVGRVPSGPGVSREDMEAVRIATYY